MKSPICGKCKRPMAVNVDGSETIYPHGRPGITISGLPSYGCDKCRVYFSPTMLWTWVLEAVFGHAPNGHYDLRHDFLCPICGGAGEYENEDLSVSGCSCSHGYVFDHRPLKALVSPFGTEVR